MKTFKEFLTEVVRSKDRAKKLVQYIADRKGGDENQIPFRNYHSVFLDPTHPSDKHAFEYQGKKTLKVKDIYPGQGHFSQTGVNHHLNNKHTKGEITVVHHKGEHIIYDGHHRFLAHKLLGKKTITAHVYKTNEHYYDN